jgi:hypothetical protein
MAQHISVVDVDGIALRCSICGSTCAVPETLAVADAMSAFADRHPDDTGGHHPGGCPGWSEQR